MKTNRFCLLEMHELDYTENFKPEMKKCIQCRLSIQNGKPGIKDLLKAVGCHGSST
jgi:hypothetical protein